VVVDDALLDPERLVRFATAQRSSFRETGFNAYPGTYLFASPGTSEALNDFFIQHVHRHFDARHVLNMHCRLSMATLSPRQLRPYQWLCHRDGLQLDPRQSIQASVLYLFKDTGLGGTGFYQAIHPAQETDRLFHDARILSSTVFAGKYSIKPGYMLHSNPYFTRVGSVPARWNRMIFYDGAMLHSADIIAPEKLSHDPLVGRLTLNGFFTSRRKAA
jgi:Family of unknown function (DUF6445)